MADAATYTWRDGSPFTKIDSAKVHRELEAIRKRRGKLTAKIVAGEARRKPKGTLHAAIFHVTTGEASDLYFEDRARLVIRSLIRVETTAEAPIIRAFPVIHREDEGREYVSAEEAALDPELRLQIRSQLLAKLVSLRAQLRAWDEFAAVVEAINATEQKLAA